MRATARAAAMLVALSIVVGACSSSTASPGATGSAPPTDTTPTATPTTEPTAVNTPTPEPTAAPTPVAAATATPAAATPHPTLVHGQYLLALNNKPLTDAFQPEALLLKPDGSGSRVIATGVPVVITHPNFNLDAVWAHTGSKVHIIKGCTSMLSDVSALGGPEVATVTMTDKDQGFVWSPDDTKIAYWHFIGVDFICEQNSVDDSIDLVIMDANGSHKRILIHDTSMGDFTLQGWKPDGTALVVKIGTAWKTVNVATGAQSTLAGVAGSQAEYSPNGTKIAFVNAGHAWVIPAGGGMATDLGAAVRFAWRPDSTSVALAGATLRIVNVSTLAVSTPYPGVTTRVTWSPNGRQIAFLKSSSGGKIFVVAAAGGAATAVPGPAAVTDVQWQP